MKTLRNLLLKILGIKKFLTLVSRIYICLVSKGFLKKKYPELFYLKTIVKPGDCCIDIGANLGYYSTFLSKIVGSSGKIYAVEPIPLFGEIWKKNVRHSKINNLELLPYALGEKEEIVQMGIPEKNGVMHHGMTKIAATSDEHFIKYFDVLMKNPDILFSNLTHLDFVKCDVEGYEHIVFSNMKAILQKYKPLVQSELGGIENRRIVIQIFRDLGYSVHLLINGELQHATEELTASAAQDFYFIPPKN